MKIDKGLLVVGMVGVVNAIIADFVVLFQLMERGWKRELPGLVVFWILITTFSLWLVVVMLMIDPDQKRDRSEPVGPRQKWRGVSFG